MQIAVREASKLDQENTLLGCDANPDAASDGDRNLFLSRALLWSRLCRQSENLRFCRNYPTGEYVHQFYCLHARLAVAIDDGTNDPVKAEARRKWLSAANIGLVELSASDVLQDAKTAAARVIAEARRRLPGDHPSHAA